MRHFIPLLGIFSLAGLFWLVRWCAPGIDMSIAQIFVFPFLLFFISRISRATIQLPLTVLVLSLCAAATALAVGFSQIGNASNSFLMARLAGDEFEIDSRIMRESLNKYLAQESEVKARRFFASLSTIADANKLLNKPDALSAVVWGNRRWVNVSIAKSKKEEADSLTPIEAFTGLKLVRDVSVFGLSYEPREATARFLAVFFSGFLTRSKLFDAPHWQTFGEREILLRDAGFMPGMWTSRAHRAYPLWELGNQYLLEGSHQERFELGALNCAINHYSMARRNLKPGDNPELYSAILNNEAVAWAFIGRSQHNPKSRKVAAKLLVMSVRARTQRNIQQVELRSSETAGENLLRISPSRYLKVIKSLNRKPHHAKKGKGATHAQRSKKKHSR